MATTGDYSENEDRDKEVASSGLNKEEEIREQSITNDSSDSTLPVQPSDICDNDQTKIDNVNKEVEGEEKLRKSDDGEEEVVQTGDETLNPVTCLTETHEVEYLPKGKIKNMTIVKPPKPK